VSLLEVVLALYCLDHPALMRVASSLVRPVTALYMRREGKTVPVLTRSLLRCLAASARSLPSVLAATLNATSGMGLLDVLAAEVDALTANPALVSQSTIISATSAASQRKGAAAAGNHSKDGNMMFYDPADPAGAATSSGSSASSGRIDQEGDKLATLTALFDTCNAVLLHCGPSLSAALRERFTAIVAQALQCASKGILPPQFSDRHMHRHLGAKLRQDPAALSLLIELATTEVFSPPQLQHQAQQWSRNLPLLKVVAELSMRHSRTAAAAHRTLLLLSTLLHPVTVALPAVPAKDTMRSYLLSVSDAETGATNGASMLERSTNAAQNQVGTKRSSEVAQGDHPIENSSTKRASSSSVISSILPASAPAPVLVASAKKISLAAPLGGTSVAPSSAAPTISIPASSAAATTAAAVSASASIAAPKSMASLSSITPAVDGDGDGDDDESLPDIDIDADPDSD
jgi:hypothetical protein